MNPKLDEIQREIDAIKARNKRVEADKAWETSWTRRILITILTYIVIVIFMVMADFKKPFVAALVPSLAYLISMSTLYYFKKWWISKLIK